MHHDPTFDSLSDQQELENLINRNEPVTQDDLRGATPAVGDLYRDLFGAEKDRVKSTLKFMDNSEGGWVYLVTDGDYVKIGWSENVSDRMNSLQIGNARPLRLILGIGSNDKNTESVVQRAFEHKHVFGEWYELAESDVAIIRDEFSGMIVECGFNVPRNRTVDLHNVEVEPRFLNGGEKVNRLTKKRARKTHVEW